MNQITILLQNKHTTISAVVVVLAKAVEAQWPQYKPFCDALFDGAIAYGLLKAGDAKQPTPPSNETPNTPFPPPVH